MAYSSVKTWSMTFISSSQKVGESGGFLKTNWVDCECFVCVSNETRKHLVRRFGFSLQVAGDFLFAFSRNDVNLYFVLLAETPETADGLVVLLERVTEPEERDLVANAAERGAELQAGLRTFVDHPLVGEARGVGLIAALEIVAPEGRAEEFAPGKMGAGLNAHFLKNGLISRNMMDAMAFCPPMIIQSAQISEILAAVEKSLDGFETELNTTVAYVASGS